MNYEWNLASRKKTSDQISGCIQRMVGNSILSTNKTFNRITQQQTNTMEFYSGFVTRKAWRFIWSDSYELISGWLEEKRNLQNKRKLLDKFAVFPFIADSPCYPGVVREDLNCTPVVAAGAGLTSDRSKVQGPTHLAWHRYIYTYPVQDCMVFGL